MSLSRPIRPLLPLAFLVGLVALALVVSLVVTSARVEVPGTGAPAPVGSRPSWPSDGQAAVSIMVGDLRVSDRHQRPVPIASVTKIMTALVVLDRSPMSTRDDGFTVTVTAEDVDDTARRRARSESVVELGAGDRLTQRQALLALLLPSANNVAHLLAVRTAGSESEFVDLMNSRARRLGMRSTTYADASGFDPASQSTAHDQTLLARAAMKNPVFARLVARSRVNLPTAGAVTTTNKLLGQQGFVGMKTGSTTPAGGCFVFAADRVVDGHRRLVVGAVLGQRDENPVQAAFRASEQLVDSVTDRI